MAISDFEEVTVNLTDRSYQVIIGDGAVATLGSLIPDDVSKVAIVTQKGINVLPELSLPSEVFYIDDGEQAKSLETIGSLCSSFASFGVNRKDLVLAIGGGIVSDTAGFAAATFHRGIRYGTLATTLLSQVDAAIGGKTGVNIPEGKNLVGAFWQPSFVICDTLTLKTLPKREYLCGLGEMAKYAFLGVDGLETMPLVSQIRECVRLKADVVQSDERESDRRALLNYGHTLAHALEAMGFEDPQINLKHGEAVAIGIIFAARLALSLGRIDSSRVSYHYAVIRSYGLPSCLPEEIDLDRLVDLMYKDKKSIGTLAFILDSQNGLELVKDISPSNVKKTLLEFASVRVFED